MQSTTTKNSEKEIRHHSGMLYVPGKTYWVAGARSAWDTVLIGLYESENDVIGDFPQCPKCAREATKLEVNQFFNINN